LSYAIISLGGKQHRVREGEWLLVDRVPTEPGKTFNPTILMLGGDGNADFDAKGATVTVKVVEHVLGEKIRIGKYRPKNGYKRHNGYRSRLSKIEVQSISVKAAAAKAQPEPVAVVEEKPTPVATPKPAAKPKPKAPAVAAEKPKAPAKPKPAAAAKPKPAAAVKPKPAAAAKPKAPAKPKPAAAAKPAAAKPKAPARKPAPKKETDT